MKSLLIFVTFFLLLLQLLLGHSLVHQPDNPLANMDEESEHEQLVAIDKRKYHHHKKINCGNACSRRCGKSSRKKVCKRACKSCCKRCQCVPPGTYGNTHVCPCYAGLRTHGNRPKCP